MNVHKHPHMTVTNKRNRQAGFYFVLSGILIAMVMLALVALVGTGLLTSNRTHLNNVANLAALAAVAEFNDTTSLDWATKATAALQKANDVIAANSVKGPGDGTLGALSLNDPTDPNGFLQFGQWYDANEAGSPASCNNKACFKKISSGTTSHTTNAVWIQLKTPHPLFAPFGGILGASTYSITVNSMASVRPRCLMLGLDMSTSIVGEHHLGNLLPDKGAAPTDPLRGKSLFAYPVEPLEWRSVRDPQLAHDNLKLSPSEFPPSQEYCDRYILAEKDAYDPSINDGYTAPATNRAEVLLWCLLAGDHRPLGSDVTSSPRRHYRSDYRRIPLTDAAGNAEDYLVNTYVDPTAGYYGPQPWYDLMSAANAGLRQIQSQSTAVDHAGLLTFDREVRTPKIDLTKNLDLLIQLTNPRNRGTVSDGGTMETYRVTPNFVDFGLFPRLDTGGGTNLYSAAKAIIDDLSDTNLCPAEAQKIGVLATDGLLNCTGEGATDCSEDHPRFQEARNIFTGTSGSSSAPSISKLSREAGISWVILHFGKDLVMPHFKVKKEDGLIVNPMYAAEKGITATSMVDASETNVESEYDARFDGDNPFLGTGGFLYELAERGIYCPLIPPPPSGAICGSCTNCYDTEGVLNSSCFPSEGGIASYQEFDASGIVTSDGPVPYREMSVQEQAARCTTDLIKSVPYLLRPMPYDMPGGGHIVD